MSEMVKLRSTCGKVAGNWWETGAPGAHRRQSCGLPTAENRLLRVSSVSRNIGFSSVKRRWTGTKTGNQRTKAKKDEREEEGEEGEKEKEEKEQVTRVIALLRTFGQVHATPIHTLPRPMLTQHHECVFFTILTRA